MALEVAPYNTVQNGLRELVNAAYSMSQNMQARVDTPVLQDNTNLWQTWLDSRTIQLYGGVNEDSRHRFKIDHSFDISTLVNATISSDGSVKFNDDSVYKKSEGTEFIIISKKDVQGADEDYAIRADKYASIRDKLNQKGYTLQELQKAGGFKINAEQTSEEALASDGWLEFAVGKNKATAQDYALSKDKLKKYVSEAQSRNCFKDGKGMGIFVETGVEDYKARPWCLSLSDFRSGAYFGYGFSDGGRFLRVRDIVAAEGSEAQKIMPYESALKEAERLAPEGTPLNPILTGLVNTIYRKR